MQIISVLVMAAREDEGRQACADGGCRLQPIGSDDGSGGGGWRGFDAGRKSRGASDISPSIRSDCRSNAKSHPQVSKIETPSRPCSARFIVRAHG